MAVNVEALIVNPNGANAVNVQDGGNDLSIDDGGNNISIDDGGNSITIDGTVTTTPGATSLTVLKGTSSGISATTDTELLAQDASNLYNITDILVSIFTGSAAPAAGSFLALYHGTAGGTEFARFYFPKTLEIVIHVPITFASPSRGAVNENVSAKLAAALGTGGTYSVTVHAHKTLT